MTTWYFFVEFAGTLSNEYSLVTVGFVLSEGCRVILHVAFMSLFDEFVSSKLVTILATSYCSASAEAVPVIFPD